MYFVAFFTRSWFFSEYIFNFFYPFKFKNIFSNEIFTCGTLMSSHKNSTVKSASYWQSLNHRSLFRSFCGIYTCRENGEPIWHYFSRQTDFIDLCTRGGSLPLSPFLPPRLSRSRVRVRAAESEPRENGGTERPIKLTNANTSRLGSGVGAGRCDARSSVRLGVDKEGRADAAGPDRNRQ